VLKTHACAVFSRFERLRKVLKVLSLWSDERALMYIYIYIYIYGSVLLVPAFPGNPPPPAPPVGVGGGWLLHGCIDAWMHRCIDAWMHIDRYLRCMGSYMHTCTWHGYTCIDMHIHAYAYAYTCICMHIHAYIYMQIHAYTCIHVYLYTCIHAYIHTCVHAFMHTCIHVYMHTCIHETCIDA
jgi:hypothetical protein